jgi:hypothetical protein
MVVLIIWLSGSRVGVDPVYVLKLTEAAVLGNPPMVG